MIRQSPSILGVVTALVAFLTAGLVLPIRAAGQESREPASGAIEGIKVHGHWVIEVRNPDGTLDTRREFDNALATDGAAYLAQLLGRALSAGFWRINLYDDASGDGPCLLDGQPARCSVREPDDAQTASHAFPTLAIEVSAQNELVLRGTLTAQRDAPINTVLTMLYRCTPDLAPDAPVTCQQALGTGQFSDFTSTILGSAVSVVTGQQILVTVTMSFS